MRKITTMDIATIVIAGTISAQGRLLALLPNGRARVDAGGVVREGVLVAPMRAA